MAIDISELRVECARLRTAQAATLALVSQGEVVEAIVRWASQWRDFENPFRREAQSLEGPFSWEIVDYSLTALLESLTCEKLWELIDSEGVRENAGPALIGHVIAANTPLLSWVSLLRGLLMRSAAIVKLPSGPTAAWADLFMRSLAAVSPMLAESIALLHWPGGTEELDACLCHNVDALIAYGSDATILKLRRRCPNSTVFVGYGHRVSFGLMLCDAAWDEAASGFSRDVLLYDQGGCLSAQTIFVEGDFAAAQSFGATLAAALAESTGQLPQAARSAADAASVRAARSLARMVPDSTVWEDEELRWTVIVRPDKAFIGSLGHGIVSVQPLALLRDLPEALSPMSGHLQGCAVAARDIERSADAARILSSLGTSHICAPGDLQRPPFSWREDGRDLLRSFLPSRVED